MQEPERLRTLAGFGVHVLTASGAAFALLALMAAVNHAWSATFAWLGLALVVDAIDGPVARRLRVHDNLPRWSGETLDLVVDFVTYVFVPAYIVGGSGLLPPTLAIIAAVAIVMTGALYFSDRQMKRPDHAFSGFPGLWNLVAFYLLLLRPPAALTALAVAILCVATFVPFPFIHPVRVARLRAVTLSLVALWAALGLVALLRDMSPGPFITLSLCAIAFYVVAVGFWPSKAT